MYFFRLRRRIFHLGCVEYQLAQLATIAGRFPLAYTFGTRTALLPTGRIRAVSSPQFSRLLTGEDLTCEIREVTLASDNAFDPAAAAYGESHPDAGELWSPFPGKESRVLAV